MSTGPPPVRATVTPSTTPRGRVPSVPAWSRPLVRTTARRDSQEKNPGPLDAVTNKHPTPGSPEHRPQAAPCSDIGRPRRASRSPGTGAGLPGVRRHNFRREVEEPLGSTFSGNPGTAEGGARRGTGRGRRRGLAAIWGVGAVGLSDEEGPWPATGPGSSSGNAAAARSRAGGCDGAPGRGQGSEVRGRVGSPGAARGIGGCEGAIRAPGGTAQGVRGRGPWGLGDGRGRT